jgi:CheY-like chemotaxis protein
MGKTGKPKRRKTSRPQDAGLRTSRKAKRTLLVLHVNDSTDDQVLFQTACRHAKVPFVWHVADSAEKALSYLRTLLEVSRLRSVSWPDLVLLDIVMPGDSGLQVLEYMRATPGLKTLPVVVFTAEDDPKMIRKAQELGANSYLLKPKQFHETVQLVSSLYGVWSKSTRPVVAEGSGRDSTTAARNTDRGPSGEIGGQQAEV